MSAQLTLTDAEMEALLKCICDAGAAAALDPGRIWAPEEINAVFSAQLKLQRGLDRPSRRRRRQVA